MMHQVKILLFTIKTIININKKQTLVVAILTIVSGASPIISLKITQNILNSIQSMNLAFAKVIQQIILYCVFSVFVMITQNISGYFTTQLNILLTYKMKYILIEKCGELALENLESSETYDMISRLEDEVAAKPYEALRSLIGIISAVSGSAVAFSILLQWNKTMFLIIIAISVFYIVADLKIANQEFDMRFNRSDQERKLWYYSFLLTKDTAFKEVKILKLRKYFLDKYWKLVKQFMKQENHINKISIFLNLIITLIQDVMAAIVMYIAIREAYQGTIMIGTALVYINITGIIQSSTGSFASNIYSLYNSNLYMNLLKDFLALNNVEKSGEIKINKVEKISVSHVNYDYPNQKEVLKDLNFEINRGERVAVVGENGSGKSTLLKILCGLYQPKSGTVRINDEHLTNIDHQSFKDCISVLFQDFLKFEGPLWENIHIGNINKEKQMSHIKTALNLANVNFLKKGIDYEYEHYLGNWFDGGSQLSGGQWQKIALARVYYKDASLYLLDEPSSALDITAEMKVFNSFFQKSKNKIGIFITHRVKIAKQAEKIIVMNQGEIIGIGNHHYLYDNCMFYRKLCLKEEELSIETRESDVG